MTTTPPMFCFVIPCFNEEDNVGPTVESIRGAMGGRSDYEIIVVNDASTDCTLQRMQALATANPRIRVLDNLTNLGFGGSYKRPVLQSLVSICVGHSCDHTRISAYRRIDTCAAGPPARGFASRRNCAKTAGR